MTAAMAAPAGTLAEPVGGSAGCGGPAIEGTRRMDIYHVWCDPKSGVGDLEFAEKIAAYMGQLKSSGLIEGWRLMRRKLGLAPTGLGDFHLMIEVRDMAQLEAAFQRVASRREPVESVHFAVNSLVDKAIFGLYRDFPDPVRHHGEERF
jgi:hypothetical protein